MHARALLQLRQIETILARDLVHVDLKQLRARSNGGKISEDTALVWKDVLVAVAMPLSELANEVARLEEFVESRKRALLAIKRVLGVTQAITVLVAFVALARVYASADNTETDGLIRNNITAGIIVFIVMILFSMYGTWKVTLDEDYKKVWTQVNTPIYSAIRVYKTHLSDRFIVKLMAAIVAGLDPLAEVVELKAGVVEDVQAATDQDACAPGAGAKVECEIAGITVCDPGVRNRLSIAGMHMVIRDYCAPILVDMADKLIDLKDHGIDRYDRNALWDCVDVGVAGVKQIIEARYDDASPLANFSEASAIAVVRNEVVPLFKVGGAALNDTFLADKGKSPGPATDPSWRRLVPSAATTGPDGEPLVAAAPEDDEDPTAYTRTVERPQCFAACRSATACTAAYYHQASGQCYLNESKGGVLPGYKGGPGAGGVGSDSLMIVADGGAVFSTTRDPKTTELLTYESTRGKDGAGVAALLRADAARIIARAVDLVRRYRFQLDILASRNTIDGELIKHYGAVQYESTISAEVDLIMEALRVRVAAARKTPDSISDARFMHPDRVVDRIRLLPDRDTSDMRRSLAALRTCILSYTKMFPAFESAWYKRVSSVFVLCGNIAMCVGFLVYLLVAYTKTMARPDATVPAMIQAVVVVFCIYAISISVVETLLNKAVSKDEHNASKIQQNGQILTAVSGRFVEQYAAVVKAIRGDRDGTRSRAAAATLLSDGKLLLEKYEQCNTVTHGQVSMPMPLAEIVMYALVALVFLGVTVIVVSKVSPADRVTNIRVLQSLGARIDRGDAGALIEASSIIECARPNMHIWNLFTWFGILVFATITVWFVLASQTVATDYRQSLLSKKDCT